ncbi:sugar-binding transcriptional regulator [Mycolicibacterium smegmatis]|uniref:Deoxyribonucleoside regulator n=1 Tax=Mycolicibacterium smegmatis TaxID=1772 RepID=A0A653FL89_MYCSM|nr:sugar-binding domain-containing protein [Mycolicibacterium smegmatis]AIU07727.1 transcriptional regulator [Mycolicibacterium smegmatis MC2 155]AIU14352.1 transcriptional regulator [Mycolicibacterium smegmatis]AIU20975.1 transcriptional regulator [Mycolicibacterium smegmatis]MBE9620311.1 helix-turn-helix domain-containing protein [Mycolicibacterium smegmatis]MBE9627051.1 helix-turn-helix domain-containing protein [Mycolicibacterium smegmatis]
MTVDAVDSAAHGDATDAGDLTDEERRRVADAAELYYVQGLKVEDVGKRMHLSRSTVSRMLARARQHGVVEFVLHRTPDRSSHLAAQLNQRFGIRTLIADSVDAAQFAARLEVVAEFAARRLAAVVGTNMTIAVAWGATVEAVSRHLIFSPTRGARVVQLNGSASASASNILNAGQLLDRFARAFSASAHHFPAPAFFDSATTREAMWQERSIQRVLGIRRNADVALFSVGALDNDVPDHLYRSGYLDAVDLQELRRDGIVGHIGSVFLRADGTSDGIAINRRSTGMPLSELRSVRTRILVASGPAKTAAVLAALRAGAATDLVLDEITAQALLDA